MRKTGWMSAAFVLAALVVAGASIAQVDYGNRPPPPPPPNYYPKPPPPGYGPQTVSCGSPQHRLLRCPVPGNWRGVRIVQQTSKSACIEGRTWGFDRGGIWVDQGCGGVFAAAGGW